MKKLFFLIGLLSLLFTACNNDENSSTGDTSKASLSIKLSGQSAGKSITRAMGTPTQLDENKVLSFKVYVFQNNKLEQSAQSIGRADLLIENLTTGSKKVVVIANASTYPNLAEGSAYEELAASDKNVDLGDQQSLTNGLIMTGEINTTLQSETLGTNEVTVPVRRIVAKLKLGSITIEPAAGNDILKFSISGVAVIKGKGKSSLGLPSVITTIPYYSGIEGFEVHTTNVKTYLFENATIQNHDDKYFYIFANDTSNDDEATLLTIEASYNDETVYFPFRIKNIKNNTEYTINVTLKRIGAGSPDPEIPSDPATLEVTVEPQNWVVAPVINVEW